MSNHSKIEFPDRYPQLILDVDGCVKFTEDRGMVGRALILSTGSVGSFATTVGWGVLLAARALWEAAQPKRPELPAGWSWATDTRVEQIATGLVVTREGPVQGENHFTAYCHDTVVQILQCVLVIREWEEARS